MFKYSPIISWKFGWRQRMPFFCKQEKKFSQSFVFSVFASTRKDSLLASLSCRIQNSGRWWSCCALVSCASCTPTTAWTRGAATRECSPSAMTSFSSWGSSSHLGTLSFSMRLIFCFIRSRWKPLNVDPDPAFWLYAGPDLDPGQT